MRFPALNPLLLIWLASMLFAVGQSVHLTIFPPPRQIQVRPSWILRLPIRIKSSPFLSAPAQLLKSELTKLFGNDAISDTGKTIISLQLDPQKLQKNEEYAIDASAFGISILSHDLQGAFWAVHSLMQVLSSDVVLRTPVGWNIPGFRVRDYPQNEFRAFMIQGAWATDIEALKLTLKLLARFKVRYFALEFGPQVILDFDPSIVRGARFTKAQAKELIEYARSLGLEPIGYLNMLGHLERAYTKYPYTDHGGIMIQRDDVYNEFVFPILSEMLEIYGSIKWFHCGMDEAWELFEYLSEQGYDSAQLLANHVRRINDFLQHRGVRMVIWHDMFFTPELEKEIGAPIGPANGGPPRNTAKALELIPKYVILDYWFYDPLDSYPALDWLKSKGFEVWASPWQTPFSFVRYAQARGVPTLGTLWADPPGCFSSRSLAPVIALYAWASWNPDSAPTGVNPERDISSKALQITLQTLWGREKLGSRGAEVLLLRPGDKSIASLAMPKDIEKVPEQHYGVPFDFTSPHSLPSLKGIEKNFEELNRAEFVLLPKGIKLKVDGVNRERRTDELIIYTAPYISTGTNIYGVEVAVSSNGEVVDISDYGSGNMAIPPEGLVLSAHLGPRREKANALKNLRPGDRIAILDKEGNFLGGFALEMLKVELPDGFRLNIDGVDKPRDEDELILYLPGFNKGSTGTNQFGVEVIVENGKVMDVRNWKGNNEIPHNGYVLSAHWGPSSVKAKALANLKRGDEIRILLKTPEGETTLEEISEKARWQMEIGKKCREFFIVISTERSSSLGTPIGIFKVRYQDGSEEVIPIRYNIETIPLQGEELPITEIGKTWLIFREGEVQRLIAREWLNPKPGVLVESISFIPSIQGLEVGIWIMGITAVIG